MEPANHEVRIDGVDHDDAEAAALFDDYLAELESRVPVHVSYHPTTRPDTAVFTPPGGGLWLAHLGGVAVGGVGLKRLDARVGELKRMFVRPEGRGAGVGRALLDAALDGARAAGYEIVRLDTRSELTEAASLYERSGFVPIERYNDNPTADSFWEMRLG